MFSCHLHDRAPGAFDLRSATGFEGWVLCSSLEFWAGLKGAGNAPFAETANSQGTTLGNGTVRVSNIASLTACYAQAAKPGEDQVSRDGEARSHALRGWDYLESRCWSTISGWPTALGFHGQVTDQCFTLENQAQAITACALIADLQNSDLPLTMAIRTMTLIDRNLRERGVPGWLTRTGSKARELRSNLSYLTALLLLHTKTPNWQVKSHLDELAEVIACEVKAMEERADQGRSSWHTAMVENSFADYSRDLNLFEVTGYARAADLSGLPALKDMQQQALARFSQEFSRAASDAGPGGLGKDQIAATCAAICLACTPWNRSDYARDALHLGGELRRLLAHSLPAGSWQEHGPDDGTSAHAMHADTLAQLVRAALALETLTNRHDIESAT